MSIPAAVLALALVLLTLPAVVEALLLALASFFADSRLLPQNRSALRLAVLVPAHDEERQIERTVRSLGGNCTVIAHNCTDRTAELAATAGARVWPFDGAGGKGTALKYGFARLLDEGADAVLVIDADSIADAGLVDAVCAVLAAGADAVQCRYEMRPDAEDARQLLRAVAFRAFNHVRAAGRSVLGLSAGIFGCGFALSRRTLERVPYAAHSGVEDLEYHLELVLAGLRVEYLGAATVASELPATDCGNRTQQARWDAGRRRIALRYAGRVWASGKLTALEAWMNAAALPLSLQAIALLVLLALAATALHSPGLLIYAGVGLAAILLICVRASSGYPKYLLWKAIVYVPYFVAAKLRLLFRRNPAGAWVRTDRQRSKG